jgi:site-specific DNA-methyltransferase (adenine-specific)
MTKPQVAKAERNRTITLTDDEIVFYRQKLVRLNKKVAEISNKTILQDTFEALKFLPENSFDLMFADPPYNLTKQFGGNKFLQTSCDEYEIWLDSWLSRCLKLLKPTATVYICGDSACWNEVF